MERKEKDKLNDKIDVTFVAIYNEEQEFKSKLIEYSLSEGLMWGHVIKNFIEDNLKNEFFTVYKDEFENKLKWCDEALKEAIKRGATPFGSNR